ncbi:MAG: hypothetical protein RMJ67_02700 [Elusimicrobiota bacterium]|nr:hypothetical protein [Endomicrobiia bacterium]MDW8165406.1 hypothetical protein [Elusimicrobiota bacterium]
MKKLLVKVIFLAILILFFNFFCSLEEINPIFISSFEKVRENEYNIILSNVILIREIKLNKIKIGKKEITELELPSYKSSTGREYPQIKILSDKLYQQILKTLVEEKIENIVGDVGYPDFKINKFISNHNKNSKIKINASVVFGDSVEVECKIMEDTSNNIIVLWPSQKINKTNKWIKLIEFISPTYQKFIEKQLIHRYKVYKLEKGI